MKGRPEVRPSTGKMTARVRLRQIQKEQKINWKDKAIGKGRKTRNAQTYKKIVFCARYQVYIEKM